MQCEILSIGSELTSGQNLDTNSQWLSQRLAEMGIAVGWHTTIADDLEANVEAFRIASQRAGLVLASGGLGPTQDDLTREVLARVAGVELEFRPELLEQIEAMFRRRNRVMPERNRVQAYVPTGAEPIDNAWGTAPGVWMKLNRAWVGALPGVPSEMKPMFQERIQPRLQALGLAGGVLLQRKINTFGAGESAIEEKLFDITRRGHIPEVGITASDATISLRILARGADTAAAQAQIAPIEQIIRDRLGELVFGVEGEDLEDAVAQLLHLKQQTISTAESLTGGMLAGRLVRVPGISKWFKGGVVAYDPRLKVELLGVPLALIQRHGVVSSEVAAAMAIGCRERLGTDLALSTTGIAGPDGGTPETPVGTAWVGLAWAGGHETFQHGWSGTREEVRNRACKLALNRMRLKLLQS